MATELAEAVVSIRADMARFEKDLKRVGDVAQRQGAKAEGAFSSAFAKIGAAAAAAFSVAAITQFGASAIKAASDLQETTSKFETVFGDQLAAGKQLTEELTAGYAMSTEEARRHLAAMQDLLVPMGMAGEAAANMSGSVVKLAADMGSFNNLPTEQVMADIQSALVGNFETMKKYGVVLNATRVEALALAMNTDATKESLTAAQKAAAAYELILRGTEAAQGDMARTSGGFANQLKLLGANTDEFMAKLGDQLLPLATEFINTINEATGKSSGFGESMLTAAKDVGAGLIIISRMTADLANGAITTFQLMSNAVAVAFDTVEVLIAGALSGVLESLQWVLDQAAKMPGVLGDTAKALGDRLRPITTGMSAEADIMVNELKQSATSGFTEITDSYAETAATIEATSESMTDALIGDKKRITAVSEKENEKVKNSFERSSAEITAGSKKAAEAAEDAAKAVGDDWDWMVDNIDQSIMDMLGITGAGFVSMSGLARQEAMETASSYQAAASSLIDSFATAFDSVLTGTASFSEAMTGLLSNAGATAGNMFGSTLGAAFGPLGATLGGQLGSSIGAALGEALGGILGGGGGKSIWDELTAGGEQFLKDSPFDALRKDVQLLGEYLSGGFAQGVSLVLQQLDHITDITNIMTESFDYATTTGQALGAMWGTLTDTLFGLGVAIEENGMSLDGMNEHMGIGAQMATDFAIAMIESGNATSPMTEAAIGMASAMGEVSNEVSLALDKMNEYITVIEQTSEKSRGLAQNTQALAVANGILGNAQNYSTETVQKASAAKERLTAIQKEEKEITQQLANAHNLTAEQVEALRARLVHLSGESEGIQRDLTGVAGSASSIQDGAEDAEKGSNTMQKTFDVLSKVVKDLDKTIRSLGAGLRGLPRRTNIELNYSTSVHDGGTPKGAPGAPPAPLQGTFDSATGTGSVKHTGGTKTFGPAKFAKGGVVTRPTFFGFGNGARGMAGEAGPEAILPLQRDANGNLGVGGAAGGGGIVLNVSGSIVSGEEIVDMIEGALDRRGRLTNG